MKDMMKTLVRTDAGTPTGTLLRRFWIPILLCSEIPEADCPPVRVQILGEKLLAFRDTQRSEEHTSELQSLMRISYAVFCLKKKKKHNTHLKLIQTIKTNRVN